MKIETKAWISTIVLSVVGAACSLLPSRAYAGIYQGSVATLNGATGCDCTAPSASCGCVVS
jgi:hypothetical protein